MFLEIECNESVLNSCQNCLVLNVDERFLVDDEYRVHIRFDAWNNSDLALFLGLRFEGKPYYEFIEHFNTLRKLMRLMREIGNFKRRENILTLRGDSMKMFNKIRRDLLMCFDRKENEQEAAVDILDVEKREKMALETVTAIDHVDHRWFIHDKHEQAQALTKLRQQLDNNDDSKQLKMGKSTNC